MVPSGESVSDGISWLALGASFTVSVVVENGTYVSHAFVENVVEVVEVRVDSTVAHFVYMVCEAADVSCGTLLSVLVVAAFPDFVDVRV